MAHTALTADMAALHKEVVNMKTSQNALAEDMCRKLDDVTNLVREVLAPSLRTLVSPWDANGELILLAPHRATTDYFRSPARHHPSSRTTHRPAMVVPSRPLTVHLHPVQFRTGTQPPRPVQGAWASELSPSPSAGNTMIPSPVPAMHSNPTLSAPVPSLVGAQRTPAGPPMGLAIPHLPMKRENGKMTPRSETWRDIVRHWTEGEPRLQLFIPLKDWPHHYYNGRRGRHFNTLYYQRSLVAKEFLEVYVRLSPAHLLVHSFFHSPTLYLGSKRTRKTGTGHTEALSLEGTRTCSRRSRRLGNAIPTVGSAATSS